jgi:hypothetical protein
MTIGIAWVNSKRLDRERKGIASDPEAAVEKQTPTRWDRIRRKTSSELRRELER